LSYILI